MKPEWVIIAVLRAILTQHFGVISGMLHFYMVNGDNPVMLCTDL
jgi:hypothetical protein